METCEYEQLRRKNLEDNKRILAELGLSNPYHLLPKVIKKGVKRRGNDDETYQPRKKKARVQSPVDLENSGSIFGTRRLSARLRGQLPGSECIGEDDHLEKEHEEQRVKYRYVMPDRPNWYGEVQGVDVGTIWMMRIDCCRDGIHRPTVAGIHGGPDGAYSIALSGGYEDDVDLGDCFTYTGEGGRDLKGTRNNPKNLRTAPQSKDQELSRGNLALSRSVETGNPVRVIRGYKLRSPFAPDEGYRYDGLYTVEKFWFTKGLSGFGVYKFALRRCKDQAPPPWELSGDPMSPSKSSDSGFSDTASADRESVDGQKSESGDSDINTDSPDKAEEDESSSTTSDPPESVDGQESEAVTGINSNSPSKAEKDERSSTRSDSPESVVGQREELGDDINSNNPSKADENERSSTTSDSPESVVGPKKESGVSDINTNSPSKADGNESSSTTSNLITPESVEGQKRESGEGDINSNSPSKAEEDQSSSTPSYPPNDAESHLPDENQVDEDKKVDVKSELDESDKNVVTSEFVEGENNGAKENE